ncbi:hypothetical protein [Deinococcus daejeonensis]|uniref:Uncharacterized protein n=1 Tax=Deinococcus daejeonensis TaxID=1007098 RepID=A0ABQ2JF60_9DEIO|nr:hypothetical protein [Deinococcus daejeonensis]GGN44525.1 hypothetical protein GCM10010842_33190 [Deinococcus daejeonensis]
MPVERLTERVKALMVKRAALATKVEALYAALARTTRDRTTPEVQGDVTLRVVMLGDPAGIQAALTDLPPGEVVVAVTDVGRVGICSAHPAVNVGRLLPDALTVSGSKGGGRPDLAYGSTPDVPAFTQGVPETLTTTT